MNFTEEQVFKELQRIQMSVPQVLRDNAFTKEDSIPTITMVVNEALNDPDFPEEKKKEIQELKDNGHFDKFKSVENRKVTAQIDAIVNREIKKSIKEGRLPNRKQLAVMMSKKDEK